MSSVVIISLLAGILASVVIAATGIVQAARYLMRTSRTAEHIHDQVMGDERLGIPSLHDFRKQQMEFQEFVTHELSYNSGESLKDKVKWLTENRPPARRRQP